VQEQHTGSGATSSQKWWDPLEAWVREQIQRVLQAVLKQKVTAVWLAGGWGNQGGRHCSWEYRNEMARFQPPRSAACRLAARRPGTLCRSFATAGAFTRATQPACMPSAVVL
jgi:hypothetical protein